MNRLKAATFIIALFLLQNYFWFFHSWGKVPVFYRYVAYVAIMSAILLAGRSVLKGLSAAWPIIVWTYFYLGSIALILLTGLYYMFFSQNVYWNNLISHYRYYICTPLPFIVLWLLIRITAPNNKASQHEKR